MKKTKKFRSLCFCLASVIAMLILCFGVTLCTKNSAKLKAGEASLEVEATENVAEASKTKYATLSTTYDESQEGASEGEVVAESVATIGETEYTSLSAAFENVQSGETITLLSDINLDSKLTFPTGVNFTLDLNEKTITISAGSLYIDDLTTDVVIRNGTFKNTAEWVNVPAIYVKNANSVEINNCVIENVSKQGIFAYNVAENLNITNCRITAKLYAIWLYSGVAGVTNISNCVCTAGTETNDGTKDVIPASIYIYKTTSTITIRECSIESGLYGIYDCSSSPTTESADATTNIIDCSISGVIKYGIYKTGSTSKTLISGCTITGAEGASDGIMLYPTCTGEATIDGCTITDFKYGIYDSSSSKTLISGCTITGAEGASDGIMLYPTCTGEATIDGCTITDFEYCVSVYSSAETTIDNCVLSGSLSGVFVKSSAETTISNSTITAGNTGILIYGVSISSEEENIPARVNIVGCDITAIDYGVSGNGSTGYADTDIVITGSTITSSGLGIYHPQMGTLAVSDSTINAGVTGIEVRAGTVSIDNTTISVPTDVEYVAEANGGGPSVSGAAVAISQHTTNNPISVTVTNSTLSAQEALTQVDLQDIETRETVEIAVSDSSLTGKISSERVTGFLSGGEYSVEPDSTYISTDSVAVPNEETGEYEVITTEELLIRLNAEVSELNQEIVDINSQIDSLNAQIADLQDNTAEDEQQIAELEQQITDLNSQIASLNAQITELQDDTENEQKIAELEGQITDLNSQIESLNTQIADLQDNSADKQQIAELEQQITDLEQDIAALNQEIGELNQDIAALNQEIDELNQEITESNQEIDELNQEVAELQESLAKEKEDLSATKHSLQVTNVILAITVVVSLGALVIAIINLVKRKNVKF